MFNHIYKIFLTFLFLSTLFSACSEEQDPIKFSVLSTGGNFSGGYYKVDGGSTKTFTGEIINNDIYEYELKIDELDYLEVVACKNTQSQSLEIKIYRDDVKVKSGDIEPNEQNSDDQDVFCLKIDYEYGEEPDDNSTDTSE